jgi:hypothetical protein
MQGWAIRICRAAARRALGSSSFQSVNIENLTYPARNEATVIQTMSDVPADEKKDYMTSEPQSASKNIAVVQCDGFRCLAYRDADIWRDFQTGKELPEVKSVVFTFSV